MSHSGPSAPSGGSQSPSKHISAVPATQDCSGFQQGEEALRKSEERFRDLFENANDVIYTLDLEGRITSVNRRAEQIFGYSRAELLGRQVAELVPPEYHAVMFEARSRKLAGENAPTVYELEILCKDGGRVPLEISSRLLLQDGLPIGVQGTARDVRERRRAEQALRDSQERFRQIADNLPEGFIYQIMEDCSGGARFSYVSAGVEFLCGISAAQALSDPEAMYRLVLDEDLGRLRACEEECFRQRKPFDCQFRLRTPRGDIHWLHCRSAPRLLPDGRAIWDGIAVDITERKRAEETVRSLLRISARLNSTLDVEALLDILVQEAINLAGAESGLAGLYTPRGMVCQRYFHRGTVVPLEHCWQPWHGLPGWLIVHRVPYLTNDALADAQMAHELWARFGVHSALAIPILSAEGQILGFFDIHNKKEGPFSAADQDNLVAVSQVAAIAIQNALAYRQVRRAEETLKEADRRKDEFLAMLAHELRNPLAPIRNAVQVIKILGPPEPALQRVREMIDRQVAHLARLVDDLLDVSRITRGKILLRKEKLNLVPLVCATVEDHRSMLESTGLKLHLMVPDVPLWMDGDPTRLAQVVGNLLHNANKFTDAGGAVHVRLTVELEGSTAVLSVRDTGIGMEPDIVARLFEPFSQADRSLDRSRGGLGLGLALVKGLVALHGGSVQAFSPGAVQGSEFVIRLPLGQEAAGPEKHPPGSSYARRSVRVLIIEDNWDTADSLRMLLELSGHEVAVAHTGQAGLQSARSFGPDVVLCDIGLAGGMDGYAVARALRADPELFGVVLIALSGYGQEDDQRKARQAGFDRHFTKPVDPAVLGQLLETVPGRAPR
jgi:PAS domain S-box-containing protein